MDDGFDPQQSPVRILERNIRLDRAALPRFVLLKRKRTALAKRAVESRRKQRRLFICKLRVVSSLNAGFISGSPRYNYGKENFKIPSAVIEKRDNLQAVTDCFGVDLRTAALQFSAALDVAVALVVGARSDRQIQEDWNSLQAKIPSKFWDELKRRRLIEADAMSPT